MAAVHKSRKHHINNNKKRTIKKSSYGKKKHTEKNLANKSKRITRKNITMIGGNKSPRHHSKPKPHPETHHSGQKNPHNEGTHDWHKHEAEQHNAAAAQHHEAAKTDPTNKEQHETTAKHHEDNAKHHEDNAKHHEEEAKKVKESEGEKGEGDGGGGGGDQGQPQQQQQQQPDPNQQQQQQPDPNQQQQQPDPNQQQQQPDPYQQQQQPDPYQDPNQDPSFANRFLNDSAQAVQGTVDVIDDVGSSAIRLEKQAFIPTIKMPADLRYKLYETLCSNLHRLFALNTDFFQSTVNNRINNMFEPSMLKNHFDDIINKRLDEIVSDEESKIEMNGKIENKILDDVAEHVHNEIKLMDPSITKEEIFDLLKKDTANETGLMKSLGRPPTPPPVPQVDGFEVPENNLEIAQNEPLINPSVVRSNTFLPSPTPQMGNMLQNKNAPFPQFSSIQQSTPAFGIISPKINNNT